MPRWTPNWQWTINSRMYFFGGTLNQSVRTSAENMSVADIRRKKMAFQNFESLVVYPPDSLAGVTVSDESRTFLTSVGLPESAAPFLDFAGPKNGVIQTAAKLWQLTPEFNRYLVIGSNGSGDPLCIDE